MRGWPISRGGSLAERPVKFVISVEGGAEGKSEFDALKEAQQDVTRTTRALNTAQRDAATASTATATAAVAQTVKFQALGGAFGQVGALVGRLDPALAGMGQTISVVGASATALSGALGPVAQVMAGVTVAVQLLTVAFGDAEHASDSAGRAYLRQLRDARALERGIRDLAAANAATAAATMERFRQGDVEREARAAGEVRAVDQQIELTRRLFERGVLDAEMYNARLASLARLREEAAADVAFARREGDPQEQAREEAAAAAQSLSAKREAERQRQEASRQSGPRTESEDARRQREAMEFAIRIKAQESAALMALEEEQHRRDVELTQQAAETKAIAHQSRMDQIAAENAALTEAAALQRELERRATEAAEAQQALFDKIAADAERITGPIVDGLIDALTNVISGAEAAEDAFLNLLRGFLEMISQEAALQAAKEFAMAIASFASQDYSSGALHLGAGVAFTAVAVAAGVGAAAMAPPTPVAPETAQDTGEGDGGGTNVYNINGTIISAAGSSDRARAGREVGALVDESLRRYGRA